MSKTEEIIVRIEKEIRQKKDDILIERLSFYNKFETESSFVNYHLNTF
jgi:hypothetical protein